MNFIKLMRLVTLSILTLISNELLSQSGKQYLWGWGWNGSGQLGLSNTTQQNSPKLILDSSEFKSITAGYSHTIAIKKDGTLWAWGRNSYGQLGLGNTTQYNSPQQVGTDTNWASVSSGGEYTLAIKKDGTLWAWGYNSNGQLGLGNTTQYNSPQQVGTDTVWASIYSNLSYSVAIKKDGTLWAWGWNWYGQLGLGNTTQYNSPQQVGTDTAWASVSSGGNHTLAIKKDGSLWAWGWNYYGQLGLGNTTKYSSPQQVGTDTAWASVSSGGDHTLAIKKDGTLWAWGYNSNGQLGLGNTTKYSSPQQVGTDTAWASIIVGHNSQTFAIKNDGTLWAWGHNGNGQLGLGNTTQYHSPQRLIGNQWKQVFTSSVHTIALKESKDFCGNKLASPNHKKFFSDTLLMCNEDIQIKTANNQYTYYRWKTGQEKDSISLKYNEFPSDGYQWVYMENDSFCSVDSIYIVVIPKEWKINQKRFEIAIWNNTKDTSIDLYGIFGINRSSGLNFYSINDKVKSDSVVVKSGSNYKQVQSYFIGLDTSKLFCNSNQLTIIKGVRKNWKDKSANGYQSLWAWGSNWNGKLGLENTNDQNTPQLVIDSINFKSISTGFNNTLVIKDDGTMWFWGSEMMHIKPLQIGTDTMWVSISDPGYSHLLAIKKDGTLWAAGQNIYGELGLGITSDEEFIDIPIFQQVGLDSNWKLVTVGNGHSVGLKNNGTLWAWGRNSFGQLGLGNSSEYVSPQQIGTDTNWVSISAGGYHTCAIKKNGTLWAWGHNGHGQLGLGNKTNYNTPQQIGTDTTWENISSGFIKTMGLKKNGTLWAWGNNNFGNLGLGDSTDYNLPQQIGTDTTWIATNSGIEYHSTAIKKDGTLWAWGDNSYGQCGLGNTKYSKSPKQVGSDTNWSNISASSMHTIAIKTRKSCKINNFKSVSNSDTLSTWKTTFDLKSQNSKIQSYKWSNGSTNSKITVSQSGLYSLVETDSNGCIGESKVFVRLGCKPSNHIKLTNLDSIYSCTSVKLTSKNKSYSKYRWSTGDNSLSTVVSKSGLVTLSETDTKGCVNVDSVYVRIIKDEISQAPDTFLCNVKANDTLKLDLQNWFNNTNVLYFDQAKNPVSTANFFVKAGINKTWTGFAALNSYPSLKCPIKGKVNASVVYPRLVNKSTDTIKTVAALIKPAILDAKYNKYRWSTGDTTRNITLQNSGSYWYAHYWNATINGVGRYCYQVDSFHLSRINLITPSRISAKLGSKVIIKVKDSLNSNSMVVWSNGDTGWHTVYSVTKNSDTLFATQKDAYRSVTKSTVIVGRLEPIKASQEGNATGEENGSGNGAGIDTGNGSGESNGNGSSEDTNDVNSTQMNNSSNNTADAVAASSTNIRIYPNPVGSEITLDGLTHPMKYEIHTVTGQLVQTGLTSPKINVNNLQTGIYILKLENVSVKFVKE